MSCTTFSWSNEAQSCALASLKHRLERHTTQTSSSKAGNSIEGKAFLLGSQFRPYEPGPLSSALPAGPKGVQPPNPRVQLRTGSEREETEGFTTAAHSGSLRAAGAFLETSQRASSIPGDCSCTSRRLPGLGLWPTLFWLTPYFRAKARLSDRNSRG